MKSRRQAALVSLIEAGIVGSQESAVEQLRDGGFDVTQATVSRDLDDIGAVRIRRGSDTCYALIDAASAHGASLGRVLRDDVLSRSSSGSLAVLRTPPGHASMVAAAIDRARLSGVLGTIAGDDTLFVCGDDETQGKGVLDVLATMEQSQ